MPRTEASEVEPVSLIKGISLYAFQRIPVGRVLAEQNHRQEAVHMILLRTLAPFLTSFGSI